MSDIMHIGITAVLANKMALTVTSQNIANANTPFYSRRTIDLNTIPNYGGVQIADVQRIADQNTNAYLQLCSSNMNQWKVFGDQLSYFEPLLDNDDTNVGKFISDSLSVLNKLQTNLNPNNRQLYANSLVNLVNQFQTINSQINSQLVQVNNSLQNEVTMVNSLLNQIESINTNIMQSNGNPSLDLFDEQEAALQELSKYFNFTRQVYDNGTVDVVLSNGLSLIKNIPPYEFQTAANDQYPAQLKLQATNGSITTDINSLISSGSLTGWMDFRSDGLVQAQQAMGRLALVIQQNLNAQNQLGILADGTLGSNIFNDINSSGAISSRIIANSDNTSSITATVTINDVGALNVSDYQLTFGAASSYSLVRLSDNTIVDSGTLGALPDSITADGFTMNITAGTLTSGDKYIISPTLNAIGNMSLVSTDAASLGSSLALGWPVVASNGTLSPFSDGTITVDDITDTSTTAFNTPGALSPPLYIEFSVTGGGVTQYTIRNASTSAAIAGPYNYVNGADIFPTASSYDPGYRVHISGSNLQAGDRFNISYNTNATNDNRNAVAMAELYNTGTVLGNAGQSITFSQGYNLLSSNVSYQTNMGKVNQSLSKNAYDAALQNFDNISGVALEEETMNLAMYQAAYQAGAQVLQTAKTIFDIISSLAR